jgi:hypothetical protein
VKSSQDPAAMRKGSNTGLFFTLLANFMQLEGLHLLLEGHETTR